MAADPSAVAKVIPVFKLAFRPLLSPALFAGRCTRFEFMSRLVALTARVSNLQAFTDHYYNTFDTNRPALAGLYQDQSMLTFEGQTFTGAQQVGHPCRCPFFVLSRR